MKNKDITGDFEIHKLNTDGANSEITKPEENVEFIAVLKNMS